MNYLSKIGEFLGILKVFPMENPLRVQAQLNALNLQSTPEGQQQIANEWIAFQGYSAVIHATLPEQAFSVLPGMPATRTPIYNPSAGIIVKTFMNTRTGEVRLFNAFMFET